MIQKNFHLKSRHFHAYRNNSIINYYILWMHFFLVDTYFYFKIQLKLRPFGKEILLKEQKAHQNWKMQVKDELLQWVQIEISHV